MRRIDMHHHLVEEDGHVEALFRAMDRYGIERTGLIGLGPLFRGLFVRGRSSGRVADNRAVERVVRSHPDRFFGLGYLRLGDDPAARVDELADLSGNLPGWRANLSPADWQRLLWFPAASRKLLFGTDLHCAETGPALAAYESICDAAGWGDAERQRLYFGNAADLFGVPP